MQSQSLKFKIINAPKKPGVYVFKKKGEIIYAGKAKNLFKRVRSYFVKKHNDPKTRSLVRQIEDVDFTVTGNEVEALILESNIIKKYDPKYNVNFRDDKSYPCIAVTVGDPFPRITITRESRRKGTAYFGPYTNVRALRETFDTLRKVFPLRTCRSEKPGRKGSVPCLNYHIKRCLGPCASKVSNEDYSAIVKQVLLFLEGKGDTVLKTLEKQMKAEAANFNFEDAARFRNRIEAARQVLAKQEVVSQKDENFDILGVDESLGYFSVTVFSIRQGKLLLSENFSLEKGLEAEPVASFIKQYYKIAGLAPKRIYIPVSISDGKALEAWLSGNAGSQVLLHVPQRGRKAKLVKMANENAAYSLGLHLKKMDVEAENALLAAKRLEEITGLKKITRIECYDVSNISGALAVASMAVFIDGVPSAKDYRKFKIRAVKGIDDYAMIYEALSRRFSKLKNQNSKFKTDISFTQRPDLIVIDGGKGHLSVARKAVSAFGIDVKLISIAKKEEEIHIPDRKIKLEEDDPALMLVQRIRDEAHRFAVAYHKKLRGKSMLQSALNNVDGIGEVKKKALISKFGSVGEIKKASLEEIQEVSGISRKIAKNLHEKFKTGA